MDQTKIVFRNATVDDADGVGRLISRTVLEFQQDDMTDEGRDCLLESVNPEVISEYICGDDLCYQVAEWGGVIVGVIAIRENRHLFHLFVDKNFHGRGIAKRLWHSAFEQSRSLGNKGHFTVSSSSYALNFYKKMGFIPTGKAVWKNGIRSTPMEWKSIKPVD